MAGSSISQPPWWRRKDAPSLVVGLEAVKTHVSGRCQDVRVAADSRVVALGFGKFARADRIYALERITGDERGDGRRNGSGLTELRIL